MEVTDSTSTSVISWTPTSTAGFIGGLGATWTARDETGALKNFKRENLPGIEALRSFADFRMKFGDFSSVPGDNLRNILAHAVHGFFNNGGTFCYVTWVAPATETGGRDLAAALHDLERIDDIGIIAAPGVGVDPSSWDALADHCCRAKTRFAILDCPEGADWKSDAMPADSDLPSRSDFAAIYFPWIEVSDPAAVDPKIPRKVPPSGHVAGVFARVELQRGVAKAPANEALNGATGVTVAINEARQGALSPKGINCIRSFNGKILLWDARTVQRDATDPFKYVSTRRYVNYLRKSIETFVRLQCVFPSGSDLYARIRETIAAGLKNQWKMQALVGAVPEEAFHVNCDAENNPVDRETLLVTVQIWVALSKPGEFVCFTIGER